jgi:hypothetical protein
VKPHTLLDLRGNIPIFSHIFDSKLSDVKALDLPVPEPGAFYMARMATGIPPQSQRAGMLARRRTWLTPVLTDRMLDIYRAALGTINDPVQPILDRARDPQRIPSNAYARNGR